MYSSFSHCTFIQVFIRKSMNWCDHPLLHEWGNGDHILVSILMIGMMRGWNIICDFHGLIFPEYRIFRCDCLLFMHKVCIRWKRVPLIESTFEWNTYLVCHAQSHFSLIWANGLDWHIYPNTGISLYRKHFYCQIVEEMSRDCFLKTECPL